MEQLLIILGIVWLAVISPGADFAMVSRVSFIEGRTAGLYAALGIAAACWFHIAYAVFGLALVERWFPYLLDVIRFAGAAYLVYLGFSIALSRPSAATAEDAANPGRPHRLFLTGLLTNALNPKTSIFVVSLYAQIIGHSASTGIKLGYGLLISLSHLAWFGLVAIFLSQPSIRARVLKRQRQLNMGIGAILIILGLVLALADLGQGG